MAKVLKSPRIYTYEEFLEITKDMERAEFIDGEIILQATPTAQHQDILGNIFYEMKNYFKDKQCRPRVAPFNIALKKENEEAKRVQPDLSVICEDFDTTKNEFNGIPTLVVEITSPSNSGYDLITKLNLYQSFEIPEYWIVSPKNKNIMIFTYNKETNSYDEPTIYVKHDTALSNIFKDLSLPLKTIFEQ